MVLKNWLYGFTIGLMFLSSLLQPVGAEDLHLEPGMVGHTVVQGEDWRSIAELYGISLEKLQDINEPQDLSEGDVVRIPALRDWPVHVVVSGQTLWRIGKAYSIPVAEIRQANQLSDNSLLPGQRLVLPRAEMPEWQSVEPVAKPQELVYRPVPLGSRRSMQSRSGSPFVTRPDKGEEWVSVTLPDGRQAWVERQELVLGSKVPESASSVVRRAREFVGVPYRWGGTNPNGYDCSGFVQHVFALSGHSLPRMADVQYEALEKVEKEALEVGDLVFFNTDGSGISHVGLYIGEGAFLHASSSRGVMESHLDQNYYAQRYVGGARLDSLSRE